MTDTRNFNVPHVATYRPRAFRGPAYLWILIGAAAAVATTVFFLQVLLLVFPESSRVDAALRLFQAIYLYQMPFAALVLGWKSYRRVKDQARRGQPQFGNFADTFRFFVVPLLWLLFVYSCLFLIPSSLYPPAASLVILMSICLGLPSVLINGFLFAFVAIGPEGLPRGEPENGLAESG